VLARDYGEEMPQFAEMGVSCDWRDSASVRPLSADLVFTIFREFQA